MSFLSGLVLIFVGTSVAVNTFSSFTKTHVVQNRCEDESLQTIRARNSLDCGRKCTGDSGCRRYLFCSSNTLCSTYNAGANCAMARNPSSCSCYKKDFGKIGTQITCPVGYYGDTCQHVVKDCKDANDRGMYSRNLRKTFIKPSLQIPAFEVKCVLHTVIILTRNRSCSEENFNRSLSHYEDGFGSIFENSWIGFNKLLAILNNRPSSVWYLHLRFITNEQSHNCYYENFAVGSKLNAYVFSSTTLCTDALIADLNPLGRPFSTYDFDHTGTNKCPARVGGGWWFLDNSDCKGGFLTGTMNGSGTDIFLSDKPAEERLDYLHMCILM